MFNAQRPVGKPSPAERCIGHPVLFAVLVCYVVSSFNALELFCPTSPMIMLKSLRQLENVNQMCSLRLFRRDAVTAPARAFDPIIAAQCAIRSFCRSTSALRAILYQVQCLQLTLKPSGRTSLYVPSLPPTTCAVCDMDCGILALREHLLCHETLLADSIDLLPPSLRFWIVVWPALRPHRHLAAQ